MFTADQWKDYRVLDTGVGMKLERWKDVILARPDPQVIWPRSDESLWERAQACYVRSSQGGGHWEFRQQLPDRWNVRYGDLQFYVRPTGFKHTGLFPEQAANWDAMRALIRSAARPVRVLNLFGYTGGATMACAAEGAHVTHVDASKGMVAWAKENGALNQLPQERFRYIVEDASGFVKRELRRGSRYDGLVMDPPSYGRGPGGEVWKLENELYGLIDLCTGVMSDKPLFFFVNSYTTGLQPAVLRNILRMTVAKRFGGTADAQELCLPVGTGGVLPCGATGRWTG